MSQIIYVRTGKRPKDQRSLKRQFVQRTKGSRSINYEHRRIKRYSTSYPSIFPLHSVPSRVSKAIVFQADWTWTKVPLSQSIAWNIIINNIVSLHFPSHVTWLTPSHFSSYMFMHLNDGKERWWWLWWTESESGENRRDKWAKQPIISLCFMIQFALEMLNLRTRQSSGLDQTDGREGMQYEKERQLN